MQLDRNHACNKTTNAASVTIKQPATQIKISHMPNCHPSRKVTPAAADMVRRFEQRFAHIADDRALPTRNARRSSQLLQTQQQRQSTPQQLANTPEENWSRYGDWVARHQWQWAAWSSWNLGSDARNNPDENWGWSDNH
jgi:hypothetical protein